MPCPKGYYKSASGNYKCSKCPLGTIQPGTGHTACQVKMPIAVLRRRIRSHAWRAPKHRAMIGAMLRSDP